jgi:hypothetical protein
MTTYDPPETHHARVACIASALLAPASVFMVALVVRRVPLDALADAAERVVGWYAERLWTLWALLLCLPMIALVSGGLALFAPLAGGDESSGAAPAGGRWASRALAAMTPIAAAILAVVVLHMLAT